MSRPARACATCWRQKLVALLKRRDAGALHEGGRAGGVVLDQVLDHLPHGPGRLKPADPPPGHCPVLGKRVDHQELLFGSQTSWNEGGRAPVSAPGPIVEPGIDLIGDDPDPAFAAEIPDRQDLVGAHDPAERIARRVGADRPGLRRSPRQTAGRDRATSAIGEVAAALRPG